MTDAMIDLPGMIAMSDNRSRQHHGRIGSAILSQQVVAAITAQIDFQMPVEKLSLTAGGPPPYHAVTQGLP